MRTNKLLEQDEIWITKDGMPLKLGEMDPEHRRMTLAFLRRRAVFLQRAYIFCEITDGLRRARFDMSPDDEGPEQIYDEASAWLERRPLIIALARMVRDDESIDAEVVEPVAELEEGAA